MLLQLLLVQLCGNSHCQLLQRRTRGVYREDRCAALIEIETGELHGVGLTKWKCGMDFSLHGVAIFAAVHLHAAAAGADTGGERHGHAVGADAAAVGGRPAEQQIAIHIRGS